jgi:hypothetical protein
MVIVRFTYVVSLTSLMSRYAYFCYVKLPQSENLFYRITRTTGGGGIQT